jgi:hypothetical protein
MSFLAPLSVHSNVPLRSAAYRKQPTPIIAELTGSHRCECVSRKLSASGHTPSLALCRELLAVSANPDSALAVYREGVRIRSIREGAEFVVEDTKSGTPKFRVARSPRHGAAPSVRKNRRGGSMTAPHPISAHPGGRHHAEPDLSAVAPAEMAADAAYTPDLFNQPPTPAPAGTADGQFQPAKTSGRGSQFLQIVANSDEINRKNARKSNNRS